MLYWCFSYGTGDGIVCWCIVILEASAKNSSRLKRRFHGGFTSVARSASLALEESFSFSWWLATSRQPRQRACAIERASVEL
jgi:hypothetical protein